MTIVDIVFCVSTEMPKAKKEKRVIENKDVMGNDLMIDRCNCSNLLPTDIAKFKGRIWRGFKVDTRY